MSEKKHTRIGSMLALKCPVCQKASMFENPSLYTWHNIGSVKEKCDDCGANLKPESGFYFGAAYVSYGLTVALWVAIVVALKVLDALGLIDYGFLTHPRTFLITGLSLTLILFPYLFRVSRSIWAHMHIKSGIRATNQELQQK